MPNVRKLLLTVTQGEGQTKKKIKGRKPGGVKPAQKSAAMAKKK